jgi:hypothetical protein
LPSQRTPIGTEVWDMQALLYGAAAANELGLLAEVGIVLRFVCDEETGSAAGSQQLRNAGVTDTDAVAFLAVPQGSRHHEGRGAVKSPYREGSSIGVPGTLWCRAR